MGEGQEQNRQQKHNDDDAKSSGKNEDEGDSQRSELETMAATSNPALPLENTQNSADIPTLGPVAEDVSDGRGLENLEGDGQDTMVPRVELKPPQATLYVTNIDWTLTKSQIRRSLFILFSRHGKVLNVIYLRHTGLAGRAFVIFDTVESATKALEEEQNFSFFDRPLRINYANEPSDITLKRSNKFVQVDRSEKRRKRKETWLARGQTMIEQGGAPSGTDAHEISSSVHHAPPPPFPAHPPLPQQSPPSNVLLAANLPPIDHPDFMLSMLARQYPGFTEVKLLDDGKASIIFDTPANAALALGALQGYKINETSSLSLEFGVSISQ